MAPRMPPRLRRRGWLAATLIGASAGPARAGAMARVPLEDPVRVLMVTATAGFHHSSIATAQEVVPRLGQETDALTVTLLPNVPDLTGLTAEQLAQTDV